jgi:hypothetical protein
MDPAEVAGWVRAFIFTQLVEVPLFTLAQSSSYLRTRAPNQAPRPALPLSFRIAVAFLCSLLSHPVVWFGFPRLIDPYDHYTAMVIAAEVFAVGSEAMILWAVRLRGALPISFLVNMASMSLGFLLRYLTGWI